jgi:hypothetical protein
VVTGNFGRRAPSQLQLFGGDVRLRRGPTAQEEEGEVCCVPQSRGGGKAHTKAAITGNRGRRRTSGRFQQGQAVPGAWRWSNGGCGVGEGFP